MPDRVVLLTIPGLREHDLPAMPQLRNKLAEGDAAVLAPTFPCLAGPLHANMATGVTCGEHGVVADTLYRRGRRELVAMPAWRDMWKVPANWQILREHQSDARSAICFVPGSHACGADFTCNPGSGESAIVTYPTELVMELPRLVAPFNHALSMTSVVSSLAATAQPDFLWCEFPELSDAAERGGPDSPELDDARCQLDADLGRLFADLDASLGLPLWLVVSPYTISQVEHVFYPNRLLRAAGLFCVRSDGEGAWAELAECRAWAICDRQVSHVFVADHHPAIVAEVVRAFEGQRGVDELVFRDQRARYQLDQENAGDVIVVSSPDSWQAYDWWLPGEKVALAQDRRNEFHTLGSNPLELFRETGLAFDSRDAGRIQGSHGAPAIDESQRGVIFSSQRGVLAGRVVLDTDVCDIVLRQFGI